MKAWVCGNRGREGFEVKEIFIDLDVALRKKLDDIPYKMQKDMSEKQLKNFVMEHVLIELDVIEEY